MNKLTKIIATTLVPIVLLIGCAKKSPSRETLTGKPVAVDKLTIRNDNFYVVLENNIGRYYCESFYDGSDYSSRESQRRVYGLIKAEKEDGDDENVELNGEFTETKTFKIKNYLIGNNIGVLP